MIIWGNKKQREGVGYLIHSCYRCGVTVHVVAEQKSKFTVYFIPVFTYSHKAFLFCISCDAETELGGEEAKEAIASAMPRFMLEAMIAGIQESAVTKRESEIAARLPATTTRATKRAPSVKKQAGTRAKPTKATPKAGKPAATARKKKAAPKKPPRKLRAWE